MLHDVDLQAGVGAPADLLDRGVFAVARRITDGLERFIEAGYHLRDEALIHERASLLSEYGAIRQRPYLEATPAYKSIRRFRDLPIAETARTALELVASLGIGLYDPPYEHQAQAIESFFNGDDLIVATGTGSGKTEAFLGAIIGALMLEAANRPQSATLRGVRALLLYPMNALVNDQIFRIRKLFGDERVAEMLARGRGGRTVTFASYTSRTPYHGPRTSAKDRARVGDLIHSYYLRLEREQPELVEQLKSSGRWPAKDMTSFFAADRAVLDRFGKVRDGKWAERLLTGPNDRELLTRHEILASCPDILVTNYSMLEYMLLRPFERPLFNATKARLDADEGSELIVVLDEAHLYRGAAGAEVAMLLRRFAGRLGLSRERVRFIITTASLSDRGESDERIRSFAAALTGLEAGCKRRFALVRGTLEDRPRDGQLLSAEQARSLATFDARALENWKASPEVAIESVRQLAGSLGWDPCPNEIKELALYLYSQLSGTETVERLISKVSGRAERLDDLPDVLFGDCLELDPSARRRATSSLVALAAAATKDGRNLLPSRLHLFYRGLPGLFACCNPACDRRRSDLEVAPLGRMYAEPRLECVCTDRARVFEVLSHRDCGATFLRGYVQDVYGTFVWNDAGGGARRIFSGGTERYVGSRLIPIEMLVDGDPHPEAEAVQVAWLDVRTGRLLRERPREEAGFRKVFVPRPEDAEARGIRFKPCPVCLRNWQETRRNEGLGLSKIEPHATLGENPFTALTSAQLVSQPENLSALAARDPSRYPNRGRKVLIFSDGRQKAARLARDMPRMVQRDTFRQLLALAVAALDEIGIDATPNQVLYTAVISALSRQQVAVLRGDAADIVADDVRRFARDFGDDEGLREALVEGGFAPSSEEYKVAVLEQLCGRYYSIEDATIGWVEPARRALRRALPELAAIRPELGSLETALPLVYAWIGAAADRYAIDEAIPPRSRARAAGFGEDRSDWGATGKLRSALRKRLERELKWTQLQISAVEAVLTETFMHGAEKRFLNPATIRACVDLNHTWFKCRQCFMLQPHTLSSGRCTHCGAESLEHLDPATSVYLRARKGYWRDPVLHALRDNVALSTFTVAEHTAQLGHREYDKVHSTTERYELRFQDILIDPKDLPVDVLSCTTTMEVGVDIGSLVAVGLRNIPPERSNYQQRAGRAGRRGSGVSTVVTYGDRGPHGSYYFWHAREMVAGDLRDPDIRVSNAKLARRHVHAILIQSYVGSLVDSNVQVDSSLETSLGKTDSFFFGDVEPTLDGFARWLEQHVTSSDGEMARKVASWLPTELDLDAEVDPQSTTRLEKWVRVVADSFHASLRALKKKLTPAERHVKVEEELDDELDDSQIAQQPVDPYLLGFLFDANLLPTYAFPTDLASFVVESASNQNGYVQVRVHEMPQQAMSKAISEYAPGRLVVIDTATYRSGGVAARTLFSEVDRATPLFARVTHLVACDDCGYLRVVETRKEAEAAAQVACRTCGGPLAWREMIQPEVFTPEGREELPDDDREQDLTYATSAQFPLPADGDDRMETTLRQAGSHCSYTYAIDQELVAVNKGLGQGPDANRGFFVCEKCGKASLQPQTGKRHTRPYHIQGPARVNERPCDGAFRQVILGHRFVSDVLLVRIEIAAPLITNLTTSVEGRVMEDALASAAEAILKCAAKALDLDPQEFGVGYRIVPKAPGDALARWRLDIYLYDTLSGGAGYAEMASRHLTEILEQSIEVLDGCDCQRSCTRCLQHFRNQHLQGRLDRWLGVQLLRWAVYGASPAPQDQAEQWARLAPLRRLLQLERIEMVQDTSNVGALVVRDANSGRSVRIALWPALLAHDRGNRSLIALSDYLVARDLPYEHGRIREALAIE